MNLDPNAPITPSELVLLNGDQFAKKAMIGNTKMLHNDASVAVDQLGRAMIEAAVIASDHVGGIQLDIRQKKAMMGLRKVNGLFADPKDHSVSWPEGSLEAAIHDLAARLKNGKEKNEVEEILYVWLEQDSTSPYQSTIEKVKAGMARRGLLDEVKEKKMKIFTVVKYELPESTRSLSANQSVDAVAQFLNECQSARPDVWKLLEKQVKSAVRKRTESTSSDPDF